MPNWCFTEYIFTGPLKELERLERNITKWTEENYAPNGFGKDWLGNIAEGAGIDYTKIPCRGTIGNLYMQTDQERNRTGLYIDTETAWVPQHELWDFLIKKYAPHTSYLYYAEEAGLGLYETNDIFRMYFDFDYAVDSYYDSTADEKIIRFQDFFPEGVNFWKDEDLNVLLADILHKEGTTKELIDAFSTLEDCWCGDSFVYFHEVERVDSPISNAPYLKEGDDYAS